jgi:hypothetical protein
MRPVNASGKEGGRFVALASFAFINGMLFKVCSRLMIYDSQSLSTKKQMMLAVMFLAPVSDIR